MFGSDPRRRYVPRTFWWFDGESAVAGLLLVAFMYLMIVGLPVIMPNGFAGAWRGELHRLGFQQADSK